MAKYCEQILRVAKQKLPTLKATCAGCKAKFDRGELSEVEKYLCSKYCEECYELERLSETCVELFKTYARYGLEQLLGECKLS